MAEIVNKNGLLDLEKELTCSICTDVLYQPLTLLDCLHTFCGSCLKEWFSWQASQAQPSSSSPYTCPSCRALVRETRPNATVTTLLDMYLQANPSRSKTVEEKEEIRAKYEPGDSVVPHLETKAETSEDEEDRRVMEGVRELSLREVGVQSRTSYETRARQANGNRDRDARSRDSREFRIQEAQRRRRHHNQQARSGESARVMDDVDRRSQARQIEHQSSLRSLISPSEVDSQGMEQEILRQIGEEGLLDGIDINHLTITQEDELSERIADAYRRRHRQRPRSQETRREDPNLAREPIPSPEERSPRHRHRPRTANVAEQVGPSSRPPVSRPYLLDAYPIGQGNRRSSSENRRQTSPRSSTSARVSSEVQRQGARSATDLSDRPRSSQVAQIRPGELSTHGRRTTDPSPHRRRRSSDVSQKSENQKNLALRDEALRVRNRATLESLEQSLNAPSSQEHSPSLLQEPARERRENITQAHPAASSRPNSSSSSGIKIRSPLFQEPSVLCDRCGKSEIQYDQHYNCGICQEGNFNLCLRCYRLGSGCLHWYGFGDRAWLNYDKQAPEGGYPLHHQLPHTLAAHRYIQPKPESVQRTSAGDPKQFMTSDDPGKRLQSGFFCDNCSTFANDYYWTCAICNDGEWGFCNDCVNQGRCCSHPLLPSTQSSTLKANGTPLSPSLSRPTTLNSTIYQPPTPSSPCAICTYPIQPSATRFHCPQCANGTYDIDSTCYLKLVSSGHIHQDNGDKGWRRCLQGHRMIVVGFEDSSRGGQRRVVVRDLVGGQRLRMENLGAGMEVWTWIDPHAQDGRAGILVATDVAKGGQESGAGIVGGQAFSPPPLFKRFPPDGGKGMRVAALWGYWPEMDAKNELGFPKGAEIMECEDANGEWWFGCYTNGQGLFPSSYGMVLGSG